MILTMNMIMAVLITTVKVAVFMVQIKVTLVARMFTRSMKSMSRDVDESHNLQLE